MLRKIRVAILLYVLLFVAVGQYLTLRNATNWDEPLWVDAYLINVDGDAATVGYLESLDRDAFDDIADFFAAEATRFGLDLARPFRIDVAGELPEGLPPLPSDGDFAGTLWWSLRMRWLTTRLHWTDDRPTPDITLFLNYHAAAGTAEVDRSTALRKAMIAIGNVYADRRFAGSNTVVMAHELLHTLGASDKYASATNQPLFPAGYAEPDRRPLHPQTKAELMAGRIPVSSIEAIVPVSLADVVIGGATAFEIGWIESPPATKPAN